MQKPSWTSRSACTPSTAPGGVFSSEILTSRPGITILQVTGKGAAKAFKHEGGGHRFQRVPPNEKRGRTHTSTITVVTLPMPTRAQVRVRESDLEFKTCRGSGAGGQHRNVTDSAVQLKHKPSGIRVRVESERSQKQNRATALDVLRGRLLALEKEKGTKARHAKRRAQTGGLGARGDKRRTIALQRGQVHDHVLGARMNAKRYMRGEIDGLYP